jgi:hypothetical protein
MPLPILAGMPSTLRCSAADCSVRQEMSSQNSLPENSHVAGNCTWARADRSLMQPTHCYENRTDMVAISHTGTILVVFLAA